MPSSVKFLTKPQEVEGWKFDMTKFSEAPDWVKEKVKLLNDSKFVIFNRPDSAIELLDGQWLIRISGEIFPLDEEVVKQSFTEVENGDNSTKH